jgi:hypothetical protein
MYLKPKRLLQFGTEGVLYIVISFWITISKERKKASGCFVLLYTHVHEKDYDALFIVEAGLILMLGSLNAIA